METKNNELFQQILDSADLALTKLGKTFAGINRTINEAEIEQEEIGGNSMYYSKNKNGNSNFLYFIDGNHKIVFPLVNGDEIVVPVYLNDIITADEVCSQSLRFHKYDENEKVDKIRLLLYGIANAYLDLFNEVGIPISSDESRRGIRPFNIKLFCDKESEQSEENEDEDFEDYSPEPININGVWIKQKLVDDLIEPLARNAHEIYCKKRKEEGWTYGVCRDDDAKTNPTLIPYDKLSEKEKEIDRNMMIETIESIAAMGYSLVKTDDIHRYAAEGIDLDILASKDDK